MGKYSAMTVNERLLVAGLLDAFDKSIAKRDLAEAIRLLVSVELAPNEAESIVSTIVQSPAKYGYGCN